MTFPFEVEPGAVDLALVYCHGRLVEDDGSGCNWRSEEDKYEVNVQAKTQ